MFIEQYVREIRDNVIVVWKRKDNGYIDDSREVKSFTLQQVSKIINDNYNWGCRKYLVLSIKVVDDLGQTLILIIYNFKKKLLKE